MVCSQLIRKLQYRKCIKAESLSLGNFSKNEMTQLLHFHTHETGQIFTEEACEKC